MTVAGSSSSGGWERISREVLWRKYRVNLGQFVSQSAFVTPITFYFSFYFFLYFPSSPEPNSNK